MDKWFQNHWNVRTGADYTLMNPCKPRKVHRHVVKSRLPLSRAAQLRMSRRIAEQGTWSKN